MFQPAWEALPRNSLKDLQAGRLRDLLDRLTRAPAYRDLSISPGARRDPLAALPDLPFTTKQQLRDHYPWGFRAVPESQVARIHASSGTRGKPTVVAYTRHDLLVWADVTARSLAAAGALSGHLIHNAYGYGLFTGGLGLHQGAERLGATVIPASGGASRRQVVLIEDLRPAGLCCTPSFALNLAETMDEMGVDRGNLSLQYAVLGAEPWTESMRRRIEERLSLTAVDIYGLSEIIGPGVAVECREAQSGLHVFEDHFYPEVIDPRTGATLSPGERGELVLTTLTKEAMPLLRYRTGDLVSLSDEPCPCGRTHRKMSRVAGRVDDMLVVRGVNVFPSEVERVLLEFPDLTPQYQLAWEDGPPRASSTGTGGLDRLRVEVEHGGTLTHEEAERLGLQVLGRLRQELGLTLEVTVLAPKTLARPEGKAVRVVDRRRREHA
jgi:phenylacetate-CoA ligase